MSVRTSNPQKFVERAAQALKEKGLVEPPVWSSFVKTGVSRERAPDQKDWWYTRSASVLRKIHLDGPVGVEKLRTYYGGRKNRGHKPERFRKASGAVLRSIIQQLEKAGMIKIQDKKGRTLTPKGQSFLTKVAKEISGQTKAA